MQMYSQACVLSHGLLRFKQQVRARAGYSSGLAVWNDVDWDALELPVTPCFRLSGHCAG